MEADAMAFKRQKEICYRSHSEINLFVIARTHSPLKKNRYIMRCETSAVRIDNKSFDYTIAWTDRCNKEDIELDRVIGYRFSARKTQWSYS